jgi:hypothetical protein
MPSSLYTASLGIGSLFEAGVFKSTDGATSWQAAGLPDDTGIVHVFAIDRSTPTTLYAGTDGGVFKSTDGDSTITDNNPGLMGCLLAPTR